MPSEVESDVARAVRVWNILNIFNVWKFNNILSPGVMRGGMLNLILREQCVRTCFKYLAAKHSTGGGRAMFEILWIRGESNHGLTLVKSKPGINGRHVLCNLANKTSKTSQLIFSLVLVFSLMWGRFSGKGIGGWDSMITRWNSQIHSLEVSSCDSVLWCYQSLTRV